MFGGTFDPPHVAHLALAERAREQLRLDLVLFVPAARPPHKRKRPVSDAATRVTLTRLAVRGNAAFRVSTIEIERDGPSFTVDTLRELQLAHRRAKLYLLLGQDSLVDFRTWRHPEAIRRLATLVVAARPGTRRTGPQRGVRWLASPALDVSSRDLRRRVGRGESIRYLVPEAVNEWIRRKGLYRTRGARRGARTRG